MTFPILVPRLLVSVRSPREAHAALAGGADIIDVKDPDRGPLGRADPRVIAQIAECLTGSESVPLSAALGEVVDASQLESMAQLHEVTYFKLGLSGLRRSAGWADEWSRVRRVIDQRQPTPHQWVAVAYVDADAAESPPVDEVAVAAIDAGCAGLLIDTFSKSGGRLLDYCDPEDLAALGERVRREGMFFALAGRLRADDLRPLRVSSPDIIAVRSAVCENDDRLSGVTTERVIALRATIRDVFTPSSAPATTGSGEVGRCGG